MPKKINKPKVVCLFNGNIYNEYIEMAKVVGLPFSVKISNYTMEIETLYERRLFLQNVTTNSAFMAGAMVKKQVKQCGKEMPFIKMADLVYYELADIERLLSAPNQVFCIDIKKAYPTALYNYGAIDKYCYDFLGTISKKDRLAALGMLASNKRIFDYDENGVNYRIVHEKSSLKEWFFLCVLQTQKIMFDLKRILGDSFLFFWVDGIYFDDIEKVELVENYLRQNNYSNTFERLNCFNVIREEGYNNIFYTNTKGVPKLFTMPKNEKVNTRGLLMELLELHSDLNGEVEIIEVIK